MDSRWNRNIIIIIIIIRPHRSNSYSCDAAYSYRRSSVVGVSVCLLIKFVSAVNMAEPIEVPFGRVTRACPRNHVLDGGPYILRKAVIFARCPEHCESLLR